MTSANVDLVRRVFDEYARGSFAAAAEFTHPDFKMRLQTSHPLAGTLRGPRDATKAMADWMESFEGFNGEAEQFIDAGGDRVVVAFRERGRPRGGSIELDQRFRDPLHAARRQDRSHGVVRQHRGGARAARVQDQ